MNDNQHNALIQQTYTTRLLSDKQALDSLPVSSHERYQQLRELYTPERALAETLLERARARQIAEGVSA